MRTRAILLSLSVLLVLGLGDKPVRQPSDLMDLERTKPPMDILFVLAPWDDFRAMYCDREILRERMIKGTCVIDFAFLTTNVLEIPIPAAATLGAVLKQSGRKRLADWDGTKLPDMRVIKRRSILASTGQPEFVATPIDPGDFIIVVPRD